MMTEQIACSHATEHDEDNGEHIVYSETKVFELISVSGVGKKAFFSFSVILIFLVILFCYSIVLLFCHSVIETFTSPSILPL